jgi:hypothetical protein
MCSESKGGWSGQLTDGVVDWLPLSVLMDEVLRRKMAADVSLSLSPQTHIHTPLHTPLHTHLHIHLHTQACIEHKQPSGAVEAYIDRIPQLEDKCVGRVSWCFCFVVCVMCRDMI